MLVRLYMYINYLYSLSSSFSKGGERVESKMSQVLSSDNLNNIHDIEWHFEIHNLA